jgi:hypothetical protein
MTIDEPVTNSETGEALDGHELGPCWPAQWRIIRDSDRLDRDEGPSDPVERESTPVSDSLNVEGTVGLDPAWDPSHSLDRPSDEPEPIARTPLPTFGVCDDIQLRLCVHRCFQTHLACFF